MAYVLSLATSSVSARLAATRWGVICSGTWNLEPVLVLPKKLLKAWPYGYPVMSYLECDIPQLSLFGVRASLHICSTGWLECKDVNNACCTVSSSFLDPGYICITLWVYELVLCAWWHLLLRDYLWGWLVLPRDWWTPAANEFFPAIAWHSSN